MKLQMCVQVSKVDYYRFFKSGLIWENIKTMLNYGVGIAFHDVAGEDVHIDSQ